MNCILSHFCEMFLFLSAILSSTRCRCWHKQSLIVGQATDLVWNHLSLIIEFDVTVLIDFTEWSHFCFRVECVSSTTLGAFCIVCFGCSPIFLGSTRFASLGISCLHIFTSVLFLFSFYLSYILSISCDVNVRHFLHLLFDNLFTHFECFESFEDVVVSCTDFFERFFEVFIIKVQFFNLHFNSFNHCFYFSFLFFHGVFVCVFTFVYHSLELSCCIIKNNSILRLLFPFVFFFLFFFYFDSIFDSGGAVVDTCIQLFNQFRLIIT